MADPITEAAEGAGQAAGMPQLDFSTFGNQIFWLVVTLVVIYLILIRVALPRIGGVLAERAGAITSDLTRAEELRRKATEAEAAYEQALADARAQAGRIAGETRAAIQAELAAEMDKAEAQIAARAAESETAIAAIRDEAVASVTAVARDTARAIVAAFGVTADDKAVDAAVDARVNEVDA
ncbi:MAG: F0F1 ATP synthase subunit B' [Rubellimicrobium sp.]|nr:F0F1 ATP synthase subunit B' [Rubellimicrobium sp.]